MAHTSNAQRGMREYRAFTRYSRALPLQWPPVSCSALMASYQSSCAMTRRTLVRGGLEPSFSRSTSTGTSTPFAPATSMTKNRLHSL